MRNKRVFICFVLNLLFSTWINSQSTFPFGINYQAVARDPNGNAQTNTSVPVQFSIIKSTSTGSVVYQERHVRLSNSMGQFNAVIGTGSVVAGNFQQLNWAVDSMFLRVEINQNASFTGTFAIIGVQKFQAVPYALYARQTPPAITIYTAGSGTYVTPPGAIYLHIRMVGGGSGGGGAFNAGNSGSSGAGGTTTFGGNICTGAAGVNPCTGGLCNTAGAPGTATLAPGFFGVAFGGSPAQSIGSPLAYGGAGASSPFGGGGLGNSWNASVNGGNAYPNTGSGGAGGSNGAGNFGGGVGGSSGGYIDAKVTSPAASYTYSVGTGGTGGTGANSNGGNGAAGIIIVEAYF